MELDRLIKGNAYLYNGNIVIYNGCGKYEKDSYKHVFRIDRYKSIHLTDKDVTEKIKQYL